MNISVEGERLLDEVGRECIFNGINIIYKGVKDENVMGGKKYTTDFSPNTFKELKNKGINLVRLGIIWDAIEHDMGVYNDEYIHWVKGIMDNCEENGIAVYLDMHQDLYSRIFDGGAPKWATLTDGANHLTGNLWSDAYLFSEAVNKAFYNFWNNKKVKNGKGLLEHYEDVWSYVIENLGHHKALIGYDFINEPFSGENSIEIMGGMLMSYNEIKSLNKSPEEMLEMFSNDKYKLQMLEDLENQEIHKTMAKAVEHIVHEFDKGSLRKFYNRMTKKLRKKTDKGIVFIENCYFSNMGIESGVEKIIVDGKEESKQVFSPHGYDLLVDTPGVVMSSNKRIETILNAHKRVQKRLNIPIIFGEWGAYCNHEEGLDHIKYILNYFDKNKWSHTYYCFEDGILNYPVMNILSRPYPQAVAGDIMNYGFDYKTNVFCMSWKEDVLIEKPTQIYLPTKPESIHLEGDINEILLGDGSVVLEIASLGKQIRNLKIVM